MHNLSSIYEDTKIIKTAKPSITGVKRDNVPLAGVSEGTESPNKVVKRRSSLYGRSGLTNPQAKQPTAVPYRYIPYTEKDAPHLQNVLFFRFYKRIIPFSAQVSTISCGHTEDCTSPICAFSRRSIQSLE